MTSVTQMQILFSVGIMIAITAAAKVPEAGTKWPDTIAAFVIGTAIAIVGLVLWRKAVRAESSTAATTEEGTNERPTTELMEAARSKFTNLTHLLESSEKLARLNAIDSILEDELIPLSERRQEILNHYGMEKGAEILVTLAFVERTTNRMWSAIADECSEEALAVLPEALNAFEKLEALISINVSS